MNLYIRLTPLCSTYTPSTNYAHLSNDCENAFGDYTNFSFECAHNFNDCANTPDD
jgi:hypothetical protein